MIRPRSFLAVLAALLLVTCATAPPYDGSWSWDSPYFDEESVLGQAGLLSSQQDTYFTSIWTLSGDALQRRQVYQLRTQHELWVRRQVELGKMSVEEGQARIRSYTPKMAL